MKTLIMEAKQKKILKNYEREKGNKLWQQWGRGSHTNMTTDLQKSLPLDVSLFMYLKYLDPTNDKKEISVVRIGKLVQLLSHATT